MKQFRPYFPFALFFVLSTVVALPRAIQFWPPQQLLDKSELVVIATPVASDDTKESGGLPGDARQKVIGVDTRFSVSAVLKGDKALKVVVLHHYRPTDSGMTVPNGPSFVAFAVSKEPMARTYLLFLVREADGRYAPVAGQEDPGMGIRELQGVYGSAVVETQTRLGVDIGNALKECQTIKAGMTRAQLSRVFGVEGGLSTATHRTYVFHDCPYIKVDVEFAVADPRQDEGPTDKIVGISKPYLDWTISD